MTRNRQPPSGGMGKPGTALPGTTPSFLPSNNQ